MNGTIHILSTVPLALPEIDDAHGIVLDVIPFIQVSAVISAARCKEIKELCAQPLTVVFTSVHAVQYVSAIIEDAQPAWNIYCTGGATLGKVLSCFGKHTVQGTASDAAGLAAIIQAHNIAEVTFFCGSKRMDTLPELLKSSNVPVHEVVVYTTEGTPVKVNKEYDGILLFSPSGVDSFFGANSLPHQTVIFAIGNTTATAVKRHTNNKVIICAVPSKEAVAAEAIQYFNKTAQLTMTGNNK